MRRVQIPISAPSFRCPDGRRSTSRRQVVPGLLCRNCFPGCNLLQFFGSILHHDRRAKAQKLGMRLLCVPWKCRVGITVQPGPQVSPHPAIHRRLDAVVWAVPQKAVFDRALGGESCYGHSCGSRAGQFGQGQGAGFRRQGQCQSCAKKARSWSANHECADSVARGNAGRGDAPPDRSGKTRRTTGDHAR
jgi:hypothetical protein